MFTELAGWDISGPYFKTSLQYLSRDGDNPEAPWPGYGWPLGTECWFFNMEGHGYLRTATGLTIQSALDRMFFLTRLESCSKL